MTNKYCEYVKKIYIYKNIVMSIQSGQH